MKSRIQRKGRTDILQAQSGGFTDLIDNLIKEVWRINDEEFDYLLDFIEDQEELNLIFVKIPDGGCSFTERRKAIGIVENLLALC